MASQSDQLTGTDLQIDVVIVHYRDLDALEHCLSCLARQTRRPRQVVIVDNSGALSELATDLTVVYLRPGNNIGFAPAANLAARYLAEATENTATDEWLAFLNPDAFPELDWLEQLALALACHPETACWSSRQVFHEAPHYLDGAGDSYHPSGLYWRRGYRKAASRVYSPEVFSASGASMLVRRDLFLALGAFDERFFAYGEDVDFGFRLRLAGYSCRYCAAATVQHVGYSSSGGRHSEFAVYHGHRNMVWVFFKNMPLLFLYLFMPLHLAVTLLTVLRFARQGKVRTVLRAKWDAVKGLAALRESRREVQASRRISLAQLWRFFSLRKQ